MPAVDDGKKNNPDKLCVIFAKRRANKILRCPKRLTAEDLKIIENFYLEARRLTRETGIKHEVDHILPLQGVTVSGFHHPDNLQILTKSENARKGNRVDE